MSGATECTTALITAQTLGSVLLRLFLPRNECCFAWMSRETVVTLLVSRLWLETLRFRRVLYKYINAYMSWSVEYSHDLSKSSRHLADILRNSMRQKTNHICGSSSPCHTHSPLPPPMMQRLHTSSPWSQDCACIPSKSVDLGPCMNM